MARPCSEAVLCELVDAVVAQFGAVRSDQFATDFSVWGCHFQLRTGCEAEGLFRVGWPHGWVGRLYPESEDDADGAWLLSPDGTSEWAIVGDDFVEAVLSVSWMLNWREGPNEGA